MPGGGGGGGEGGGNSWLLPLLFAGASAAQGIGASMSANRRQKEQAAFEAEQAALDRQLRERALALEESQLDPYRREMFGATDISKLDMLERSSYSPTRLSTPQGRGNDMASYRPTVSGGASYTKSPEAIAAFAGLKRNVIRGAQSGQRPMTGDVGAPTAASPTSPVDLSGVARRGGRGGGGVLSNMAAGATLGTMVPGVGNLVGGGIGAAIGGLGSLFGRRASSASSDLSVEDAAAVIRQQYQQSLGRDASEEEIQQQLVAQGWKPGQRWVGQQGLLAVLSAIARSPEQRQRPSASAPALDAYGWLQ